MTERVRVLQIITGLAPGGAERLVLGLCARIDPSRFDVRIACLYPDLSALQAYGCPDVAVEVFDMARSRAASIARLRNYVRAFRPDVVHAHMFHALVASTAACVFRSRPPAVCFTSHQSVHAPWRRIVMRALRPWRTADIIFTPSQHPELNASATVVIPNGVTVAKHTPRRMPWKNRGARLICVGRLSPAKDCLGLLRAFAAAGSPDASLEFVGSGPLKDEILALAAQLGVADRVVLHGFRTDIRELLRESDVFVSHSKWEGMPLAIIEAGAEAMPVVATPVGAIPSIIGQDRGVLAQPDEFARSLRVLLDDPEAALRMGQRLRSFVAEHYTIEGTVLAHESLYQALSDARSSDGVTSRRFQEVAPTC